MTSEVHNTVVVEMEGMPRNENSKENDDDHHHHRQRIRKKRTKNFLEKMRRFSCFAKKLGKEDPRRVIHSLKVGLALTIVSLLYLLEPSFEGIGHNAIWAVMTVVLVLEFTAGATLCKGLNRGFGTLLAGSLVFVVEYFVHSSDRIFRAIFIGSSVFLVGAGSTYLRFFPTIKKNYDYGVIIFLLTFNLIIVSSYRIESVLQFAHERFYTILIGCGICLSMSLLVFPNWAGEDLHDSTVSKLEGLSKSIEACVNEYFNDAQIEETSDDEESDQDPIYEGFKKILESKSNDETMVLYASWEPMHSRHCYKCPWKQYVKLGAAIRHFGYVVVALHGCLRTEIQTPRPFRTMFKDPCISLAGEVSRALKELAKSMRLRRLCSPETLSNRLHKALQDLNTTIKSQPRHTPTAAIIATPERPQPRQHDPLMSSSISKREQLNYQTPRDQLANERKMLRKQQSRFAMTSLEFSEALPLAAFVSLLAETAAKLDNVIEEVEELERLANFESIEDDDNGEDHQENHVNVSYETPTINVTINHYPNPHGHGPV